MLTPEGKEFVNREIETPLKSLANELLSRGEFKGAPQDMIVYVLERITELLNSQADG